MGEPQIGQALSLLTNIFQTQSNKPKDVIKMFQKRQQTLAWISSDEDGAGEDWSETVIYGRSRGTGPTRAIAQQAAQGSAGRPKAIKWKGEWAEHKGSVYIEEKALKLCTRGDEATKAFLSLQTQAMEDTIDKMGWDLEEAFWANPGYAVGHGSISSGVITLDNGMSVDSFKEGDVLEASPNDGSSTEHSTYATLGYVIKTNANAKTVTISGSDGGAAGTPAGWASTIYLFRRGCFGGGANPAIQLTGLPVWIPATDPTTALLNVDRTKDVVAFSGVRVVSGDVPTTNHLDLIMKMILKWYYHGFDRGGEKAVWVHPEVWEGVKIQLENKGNRDIVGTHAQTGLSTIDLVTIAGKIPLMAATNCPYNQGYLLDKKAIRCRTVGKKIQPSMGAFGTRAMVGESDDNYEWRWTFLGAVQVPCPSACATVYLPGSPTLF